MTLKCEKGHRLSRNSVKGWYCWSCEHRAQVEACEHVYNDRRYRGILGWRCFCGKCGDMYVGPLADDGYPLEIEVA